jgi:hypothetical protein
MRNGKAVHAGKIKVLQAPRLFDWSNKCLFKTLTVDLIRYRGVQDAPDFFR